MLLIGGEGPSDLDCNPGYLDRVPTPSIARLALPPGGPGTGLRIEDYRFLDTTFYGSVNAPYAANSGAPGFLQNSRSGYSTTLPSCHKYTIAPDSTGAFLTVSVDNSAVTTITGAVESTADTVEAVIAEVAATRLTERGATRADDRVTEAAMEDRKKEGYF